MEKLVLGTISILERVLCKLRRAWSETYGENLHEDFRKKVEQIKKQNQLKFINEMEVIVTMKTLKEDGYLMPPLQARIIAGAMFNEAKKAGDLDELNNLKEKQ